MAEQKNDAKRKRWTLLDSLLSQAKPLSQEQIFDAYRQSGIKPSVPTLRKDLDIFKRALIAAKKQGMLVEGRGGMKKLLTDGNDNRTRTYCYMEKGFSVLPFLKTELTDGEYRSLISAINKLRSVLQNDKTFEEIRFAIQSRVEADYDKGPVLVDYEDNRKLTGREYRPLFYKAMKEKRALQVDYKTFKGKTMHFEFHPYILKQYNERWFAFGLRVDNNYPYTSVPLDRLIGVSKDKNATSHDVRHICIRITDEEAWGRITTKPLPTQKEVCQFDKTRGYGEICLNVIPNPELYSKILTWGKGVVVISPSKVRASVESLLHSISSQYEETY